MDEALVENAEHDVDRDDRGEDQDRLIAEAVLEHLRGAGELAAHGAGQIDLLLGLGHRRHRLAESEPRRQIEGDGDRRQLALAGDRDRPGPERDGRQAVEADELAGVGARR